MMPRKGPDAVKDHIWKRALDAARLSARQAPAPVAGAGAWSRGSARAAVFCLAGDHDRPDACARGKKQLPNDEAGTRNSVPGAGWIAGNARAPFRGSAGKWPATAQSVPSRRLNAPYAVRQGELWLTGAYAQATLESDTLEAVMPRSCTPEVRGASTGVTAECPGLRAVVGQEISDNDGADDRQSHRDASRFTPSSNRGDGPRPEFMMRKRLLGSIVPNGPVKAGPIVPRPSCKEEDMST